jgi:hypothetical protein
MDDPPLTRSEPPTPAPWRVAARAQGAYYLVTGAWPLLHMGSFLALTGPKRDLWLVRTAGSMITAIGAGLLVGSRRGRVAPSWALAGAIACAGLAAVDLRPGPPRRISRMYLADAAVELALLTCWIAGALLRGRQGRLRRTGNTGAPPRVDHGTTGSWAWAAARRGR